MLPIDTPAVALPAKELLHAVETIGRNLGLVESGGKLILVGNSDWSQEWHDMLLAYVVP